MIVKELNNIKNLIFLHKLIIVNQNFDKYSHKKIIILQSA